MVKKQTTDNPPEVKLSKNCVLRLHLLKLADRHRMFIGTQGYGNADRTFSKKRYLYPIPQSLINANSAITEKDQNPLW